MAERIVRVIATLIGEDMELVARNAFIIWAAYIALSV